MSYNIKISQLPENTSPSLLGATVVSDAGSTYKVTLETLQNVIGSGSTIGAPVNTTYAELHDAIMNSALFPNHVYRLTDYKSVNFLNGWMNADNNPTPTISGYTPQEIHTGEDEVLLLTAISSNELSPIGLSETYPGDVVEYQVMTNSIGVNIDIYNGDSYGTTGFDLQWDGTNVFFELPSGKTVQYGHYLWISATISGDTGGYDVVFEPVLPNNSFCQDSDSSTYIVDGNFEHKVAFANDGNKVILLDLDENFFNNYDTDSLEIEMIDPVGPAYGWITRRTSTHSNISVPFDFRGRKYRRFEVDMSYAMTSFNDYNFFNFTGYYGIGEDLLSNVGSTGYTGNYRDFYVFGNADLHGAGDAHEIYNIQWDGIGGPDSSYYLGYNDNNVFMFDVTDVKIGNKFYNNTIDGYFINNKVGDDCNYNLIMNDTERNNIGDSFQANWIGGNFNNNVIGHYFTDNTINEQFTDNIIGHSFYSNVFDSNFINNNICNNMNLCSGIENFVLNEIKTPINNYDFTENVGKIASFTYVATGTGATDGTYYNINQDSTSAQGLGARFNITVYSGMVTDVVFDNGGDGKFYLDGDTITILGSQIDGTNVADDITITVQTLVPTPAVYGNFNCTIFKNKNQDERLSYYDETDSLTITDLTV
jgi:hypothetical protein